MIKKLKSILQCPSCGASLDYQETAIRCQKCKNTYRLINDIPVFLKGKLINDAGAPSKIFQIISSVFIYKNKKPVNMVSSLLEKNKDKTVLNLGSGNTKYNNSINMDIGLFENVNLVADAHNLPIKDQSVDLIISYHVLEHLKNPQKAVDEFYRVLKKDGSVFIEVPFIQRFHGYPNDYYRFTLLGLKQICSKFEHIHSGMAGGPVAAISELTINFLRLLSGNNKIFLYPLLIIFLPFFFVLKYLDGFLISNEDAYKLASGVYFVGKK